MSRRHALHIARGLCGIVLVLAALLSPLGTPVARAANGVDVRATTTYRLRPAARVVRVTVDITVRNVTPDTDRVRYYYTGYGLALHRNAVRVKATSGERTLATRLRTRGRYLEARVAFGRSIFRGGSFTFRVEYDVPDGTLRPDPRTRVGRAYAAFDGYAFGEERADVDIVVPSGFEVELDGAGLARSSGPAGATILRARNVKDPARWVVRVSADRPDALTRIELEVPINGQREELTVRGWPEDRAWTTKVSQGLRRGLPVLGGLIGLPWPDGALEVVQVYSPLLGGYAGAYSDEADQIRVAEKPDEQVLLHEAAHLWFNGDLFAERWVNEGLADEYAFRALEELGGSPRGPRTVDRGSADAFALNTWPRPAPITDDEDDRRETYGYNASWLVMREIVSEIGVERMRDVIRAASDGEIAYRSGPAERMTRTRDWRLLLDLLQERGGSRRAAAVFERWVLGPEDALTLRARADARSAYATLIEESRGWRPPLALREALAAWRFEDALRLTADARVVVAKARQVEAFATALGLTASGALRTAYEADDADLAAARAIADEQLTTLETISAARATVAAERDPLTVAGLVDADPERGLNEAARAFSTNELGAARAAASGSIETIRGAAEVGRTRAIAAGVAAGLVLLLIVALVLVRIRRRRQRSRVLQGVEGP